MSKPKPNVFLRVRYEGDGVDRWKHLACGCEFMLADNPEWSEWKFCPNCGGRLDRFVDGEKERHKRRNFVDRWENDRVRKLEDAAYEARQRAPHWTLHEIPTSVRSGEELPAREVWTQGSDYGRQQAPTAAALWASVKRAIAYNRGQDADDLDDDDDFGRPPMFSYRYELRRNVWGGSGNGWTVHGWTVDRVIKIRPEVYEPAASR